MTDRTLWFEDFSIGTTLVSDGRTITPTDTATWCMFTGDMHPFHVDDEYATTNGPFGERFPPGLMSVAIGSGLWERMGVLSRSGRFMIEQTVRYRKPVKHGMTIRFEFEVEGANIRPDKDYGVVHGRYRVAASPDVTCVEGTLVVAVAARPASG